MNARRVHELMAERFPDYDASALEWTVVADGSAPRCEVLRDRLLEHFGDGELVVEVHRRLGTVLRLFDAVAFIAAHIGKGAMKISNRDFTLFCVIAHNGVLATWCGTPNPTFQRTAARLLN